MSKSTNNIEELFLIDPDLWGDVSRDMIQLAQNDGIITPSFLKKKYGLTERESEFISFAVLNRDIIHNEVNKGLTDRKYKSKIRELETLNKQIMNELELSNQQVDFLLNTTTRNTLDQLNINIKVDKKIEREGTAFGILSDIHIEERVDIEVVNGLNEYNPDIAKYRVEKYFINLLKLINKERQDIKIDKLVLGLLGDNITGYIHEDLKETNFLSPTEATRNIKSILLSGIKYLVDNGNFKEIIIPCIKGNHGRTTKDKRFNSASQNSYEWMMYMDMADSFKDYASIDK